MKNTQSAYVSNLLRLRGRHLVLSCSLLINFVVAFNLFTNRQATLSTVQPTNLVQKHVEHTDAPLFFHWSQLDSSDFPTFISKLKQIGCPEATIKDIVSGEINEIYNEKRQLIKGGHQKTSGLIGSNSTTTSQKSLSAELDQLNREEKSLIVDLFTPMISPSSKTKDVQKVQLPSGGLTRGQTAPPLIPLAFIEPPGSTVRNGSTVPLEPSSNQTEPKTGKISGTDASSVVKEKFIAQLGGENQDPNSPEYLERWNKAQVNADDQLKVMLGYQAWSILVSKRAHEKK
jgi:hypothetical protein